jgi:hypothetical protein
MSDYDNSISHYAAELGVSERQVRRYCQSGLISSAELTTGRTGRPKWVIKDTSAAAVAAVRENRQFQRFDPPIFCEPTEIRRSKKERGGKLVRTRAIAWRSLYAAPIRDSYSLIVTLAHRAALRLHSLTEYDISNPPLVRNERGLYVTYPPHEKEILAFERTEFRLLYGLCKPTTSKQYRWAHGILTKNLPEADIMRAAEHLAIFHHSHGIKITYASLARVLRISKSSMYRTYRGLVGTALKLAHKKAASPTQSDKWGKEDLRDCSSFSTKVLHDLGFEELYNAVLELHAAGKPLDQRNIYLTLRRQGHLAEGEKLSDYFSPIDVANAVRAVGDSKPSTVSHCPAA